MAKKMKKFICKYKDGDKKRRKTFHATSRAMAIIGLYSIGIIPETIISLKKMDNEIKA